MGLQRELDALREEWSKTAPAARQQLYDEKVAELRASGILETALKRGDTAPDFTLPGAAGRSVSLRERLTEGPVVLTFYRGGWCPYCNLQLRSYQKVLPEIVRLGASLVAVSPELPDGSLSVVEANELTFDVLSDFGNAVSRSYGLTFAMPPELRDVMLQVGKDLTRMNGDDSWELPVPATYVVAPDGRITFSFVDAEYRNRLEPSEIVAALSELAAAKAAG